MSLPLPPGAARWNAAVVVRLVLSALPMLGHLLGARIALLTVVGRDIVARNRRAARCAATGERPVDAHRIAQVAWLLPRLARRLPWRADCLVQAMAAQDWLAARQIESRIVLGVDPKGPKGFEAHAWLESRGTIVTGGPIDRYTELLAR